MSELLITNKQRELILNSEGAKKSFQDLYTFLQRNKELRRKDLNEYPQFKNISSYYDDLLDSCRSEWEVPKTNATNDLGDDYRKFNRSCDLCNYKYLRIENRITNKLNGKTLVIGTECVKEFGEIIQGMIKQAHRDSKRAANIRRLEEEIPGIRGFIDSSHRYINSLEIIIPDYLENEWSELSSEIKSSYDDFVLDKKTDIDNINKQWEEKNELIQRIDDFIEANKNRKYIANRKIYKWLLDLNKHDVIKMIRENSGMIDWAIAHRISEESFIVMILKDLSIHLEKLNIGVVDVDRADTMVNLKFTKENKSIIASIKYKELILNYGGFVFDIPLDDGFDEIYNTCTIEGRESKEKLLGLTIRSSFRLLNKRFSANEAIYSFKNKYYQIDLQKLVPHLKKIYFEVNVTKEELDSLIHAATTRVMNEKEYRFYKEIEKEAEDLNI